MKTIFTLLLASLFTTSAFAADDGRLTITISTQTDVQVVIDKQTYRLDDNDNTLVLNNVRPGQHTIQVYYNRGNRNNGNSQNRNNRKDILYSSTVNVRPNYDVDIMINRFGKALVDERDLRYSNDSRGYGNGGNGNYGNNNDYNQAMNEYDFNQFIQKIRNQWVGKMTVAKDGINKNYFTTNQVRQVLQLFSSENDKLELAKLAYRNTVDQRNYRQLYDVFSFQSSRDELDQYIRNDRR
jgi:hypothetical protein